MSPITAHLEPLRVETARLESVTFDIYRDIHKGIRNELFGVTFAAGSVDAGDGAAVASLVSRFHALVQVLISHAEHEDHFIQPLIAEHAPEIAAVIERDHPALEAKLADLEVLADVAAGATASQRRLGVHRLYLALSSFTAEYLEHQAFEELDVMPALCAAIPADEIAAVDRELVASIPPDEMMTGLALMLPAMNLDDRAEMLGGMRAGAPAEVFAAVQGLAERVLTPSDYDALLRRLAA